MDPLDSLPELQLPGTPTNEILGQEHGWKAPSDQTIAGLFDQQEVLIQRGNKQQKLKYDKAKNRFFAEDDVVDKMNPVGVSAMTGTGMGGPMAAPTYKKVRTEEIDPMSVDAFATGPDALETGVQSALRAAPGAVVGTGAFMAGMGAGSAAVGGPETPLGLAVGLGTGIVSSMVASAAFEKVMEHGFKVTASEEEEIGRMLNPKAAAIGDFAPTLLMFRPSGSILKAAAGMEVAGLSQKAALNTIAKGGLMNVGIAQANATADALVYGNRQDPNLSRIDAAGRSLAFGDINQEMGGGIGDRLAHVGKEFAIGGLALHKPWALGAPVHNAVHGGAQQVKLSGAPTWDALREQRRARQEAKFAFEAQQTLEVAKKIAAEKGITLEEVIEAQKLTEAEQVGISQIKATLKVSLDRGLIDQQTHDTAQRVADTMGADLLKHVQLRVGGADGTSLGSSEHVMSNNEGVINAVNVFAKAITSGKFQHTLWHEVSHPLFNSLKPEYQAEVRQELIKQRIKARASNKALDYILTKLGVENDSTWDFDQLRITQQQMVALQAEMSSKGIKMPEDMFELNGESYRLRPNYEDGGSTSKQSRFRRIYRLKDAYEFFSDEGARTIAERGEYDLNWGTPGGLAITRFLKSTYHAIKKALQSTGWGSKMIGNRTAIDTVFDKITEGRFQDVSASGERSISREASVPQSQVAARLADIDVAKRDKGLGDILESTRAEAEKLDAERDSSEDAESQQRIRDQIRAAGDEVAPSRKYLSEGDAKPSLPETSQEALKKLGIKDTVIANVVRHSKLGSIRTEFDKANMAGEVAHIFRNTSQATQESIQILVTDKDGNPLEIYRHTLSEPGSSSLAPHVMIAQALSVKGAKKVWISHNHPSMTPSFSPSDLRTEYNIRGMFKGTGLTLEGFLAIAGDNYAFLGKESGRAELERQVIPGSRFPSAGREVPIIERRFTLPRGGSQDVVSDQRGDSDVGQRMLISELLKGEPGVVFLDRTNRAVGYQTLSAEKMAKLGPSGARNLLAGYSRSGASSIVVHVGGDAVPEAVREAAAKNVANLGAAVRGFGPAFLKAVTSTAKSGMQRFDVSGDRSAGWKSEGDADAFDRGEPETRVGVGAIKPLNAAPKTNFPIAADKLKQFGFEAGYLDQFSEHAIVGELKTGVTNVRTAGDVASLIYDYSSTLAQGQTMILIVGADGRPLQVGLHMIDSSMNPAVGAVIKPMWGVLAGQAVSTPGAKEAWFVRINNEILPGEVDGSIQDETALKNLLEGSGINYRGVVSVSGGQYKSLEYKPGVQNPGGGRNQFDVADVDWMPIDVRPATDKVPLTERRYSTRSQIPYDTGKTAPDRPVPAEDAKWNRDENQSAKRLREHLGGEPGVVFKTSSGKIVGTLQMTLDEMANIRNSPAQKTLLAMMDRAGVNWGMVSIGDAPNTPEAARATSNINAFLKQMGLKVTDTFQNNLGVVPGDPVGTAEYGWKSEGDAEQNISSGMQDPRTLKGIERPVNRRSLSKDEVSAGNFRFTDPNLVDNKSREKQYGVARDVDPELHDLLGAKWPEYDSVGLDHIAKQHVPDYMLAYPELRALWDKESKWFKDDASYQRYKNFVRREIMKAWYARESFAYFKQSAPGANKVMMDMIDPSSASPTDVATILAEVGGIKYEVNVQNDGTIKTGYPIKDASYSQKMARSTRFADVAQESTNKIRRSQALRGAEPVGQEAIDAVRIQASDKNQNFPKVRGSTKPTAFSEGDAQDFNSRAEEALKRDRVVGPEAIRGDFLGWAKGIKGLADEHLFQHPFPTQYKDGADRERDQQRLQSHRIIDQLIAKLERQKGFNPMTLKPGFLDAVRRVSTEVMMSSFHELAREAVNVHDATGLDPEQGGYIPPSDNLDGPNVERDQAHKKNLDWHWGKVKDYQQQFIKHVRLSMDTGMMDKRTGMELIDMANEIRSRTFNRADEYGNMRGWGRMSEGDAENMRIPGGARDEAMKRRPARHNKTYLSIGHGEGFAGNLGNRPVFKPDKVFLYSFDSDKGKFTVRNIEEMAEAEGIDPFDVKADSFVHGDQGELGIDTGVGVKRGESGVNGRIEIDDDKQTIFVSAGSSRGELNNFRKGDMGKMRAEALAQVREYVKAMQKKGQLPKGYKIEGYGFDQNRSSWENQERFSEGDAEPQARSFREANHKDAQLLKNGFITNYADKHWIRGLQRNDAVIEVRESGGSNGRIFNPSSLITGRRTDFKLEVLDRVTGREIGHIYFDMMHDGSAYVVSTSVKERMENRGVAKLMYAELGERLRRAGVVNLDGMVIDEYVDPKTGEVIHRPIAAREAVFGLGSTEAEHIYGSTDHYSQEDMDQGRVPKSEQVWNHAAVRTKIDPQRRLSEGDQEPAMPPETNPRTNGGELANHTNAQLAKRGFISNFANSKAKSLAGMKIRIGFQPYGNKPLVPITGDMKIDFGREENTFQGVVEYLGENGLTEAAQFTYVIKNPFDPEDRSALASETSSTLDWIKVMPKFRNRDLSTVITAEVVERLKRQRQTSIDAYVVDPAGRPIRALQTVLGDNNVDVYDNGFEQTNARDQFRIQDPKSDTGFVRHTRDIEGQIDPTKLYSEGDDGENMRIPGGARDKFQREAAKVKREKPIRFWTDVGHADRRSRDGEENTYLWYATKDGEIEVKSADELRSILDISSDDIPTHADWEEHMRIGNIDGEYGKQPIMDLPHGRIDDRSDVTRISFMDSRNSEFSGRPSDYEHNREQIKIKLSEFMGKKADEVPGYDFSVGMTPERFSEGDAENMRIPGGARDEALKKREAMLRQKRFRKADIDVLYTDIGHPEDFGTSGEMETVRDISRQFLWSYDRYGQFHMQSLKDAVEAYNQARKAKYDRLIKEGTEPEEIEYLLSPENEGSFTHTEWATALGLKNIRELDYDIGNGRVDITDDGKVRMSWVAKIKDVRERQLMAEQIKEEAASWLNSNKGKIQVPVTSKVKMPFRGTEAGEIVGWNWGYGSDDATGQPRRFSEGDAENGRWPNQERAKGKIPNARVSNGETDLGFVLAPGEELDSKGLRLRKNSAGNMAWSSIGHDPEFFLADKAVMDAIGKNLPDNFDAAAGLFAYDAETGRIKTTQDRLFASHLDWLSPHANYGDENFGRIPARYSMMGRFEPAIIGTDGKLIRRGRISLARNIEGGNWVFDTADFSRSDIPPGALAKIREAVADESNAILDGKNRANFRPIQDTAADHYDTYGFGMAKDKAEQGFSPKDVGPLKLDEDAKTYRDLAERPIGEGKDGQARLLKIGRQLSEGDAVEETPFRIPKNAGRRTNMQLAKDIATARFFTGISTKAHENAAEFPLSKTMKAIADMIHARGGAEAGVTQLDLPTSIMKERTKRMNSFFDIMDPLRGEFASMDRDAREQAYIELAEMITGERAIDTSTAAGRAAEGVKALLKELHEYRTAAGEKLGEVEDYFPAVYDSIYISENAMAFKEDAKRAYMIELGETLDGEALEAAAEKKARELTMSHIRGEGEGSFNNLFESDTPAMGENSSMSRKFSPESQRIMSKWQVKDPYRIISRYIAGATKRAELVRRLGDEGQQWRKMAKALEAEGVSYEKIDEMRDLLKASVGVGIRQNTRGEQTFIDLMGLYTAGSVMGRSFLNNMFEPASMGIRSGNLGLGLLAYGETWARTIRNAARIVSGERIDKTFWEQYAEHIGTISADVNDAWMNSHSIEVDGDRSDPRINWLTSKVYQANLLQMTENAKLQASHAIGFKYLVNLAEMHQGKSWMNRLDVTESVRSNLRELGIADADHAQFAQWMTRLSSLDDAGRMRMLTSGGKMAKLFETALTKFSLQSSVRASRAHKPTFQDGPIGKTLFQLMSYSYSYAAEVNSRTYSYAKSALKSAPAGKSYTVGDRIRFMAPLMMVPLGIIAYRALFALKDELYPTEYSKKHENDPAWTKWLNASSYAGAFGPKVEMATKYVMRDQPPGGPLGQTVVGAARAAKTAITNQIEGKPQDNAIRQAAKASVPAIKAAGVIGATAAHPAAGTIASQLANSTGWSNAMTEPDKTEAKKKPKERR